MVRSGLQPSLITLLSYAVINNPRSGFDKAGDPVLFHRPGTFPNVSDPEYAVANETRLLYKTGELPMALRTRGARRRGGGAALLGHRVHRRPRHADGAAGHSPRWSFLLPILRVLPSLYAWTVRRRLLYWYRQLKALEAHLDDPMSQRELSSYQAEIERIDDGVRGHPLPAAVFRPVLRPARPTSTWCASGCSSGPQPIRMAAE